MPISTISIIGAIAQQQRCHERLFQHQVVEVNGEKTGGDPDLAKLFLESCTQLLRKDGFVGLVVPSAFHANEGATGFVGSTWRRWVSDIATRSRTAASCSRFIASFKFAVVVAQAGEATDTASCAFYLHDDEWLFSDRSGREPLPYTLDFIRRTAGDHLSLLELRSPRDLDVAEICFASGEPFGQVRTGSASASGRELHMTDDAWRFTPTSKVLAERGRPASCRCFCPPAS